MIDKEGYIKLADFGISKHINDKNYEYSCFGTYEYMAPEVVEVTPFNKKFQIDWWAFGILLYELRYRTTPFKSKRCEVIEQKILTEEVKFPDSGDEIAKKNFRDLIRQLLIKDPTDRLGYSEKGKGAKEIKKHKFFSNINFKKLLKRELKSPFIPNINNDVIQKKLIESGYEVGVGKDINKDIGETDLATEVWNRINKYYKV